MSREDLIEKEFNKFKTSKKANPRCRACDKEVTERDLNKVEFIKNKRGGQYFLHRECICGGL